MRFEALLRAHGFLKVERPPEIWEAATDDTSFIPLLGEMIAAVLAPGLDQGVELKDLTLNVSNVVAEPSQDEPDGHPSWLAPGEYVAVTVSGPADVGPDATWRPGSPPPSGVLSRLDLQLEFAGARFAYVRRLPPNGSITVFLDRLKS